MDCTIVLDISAIIWDEIDYEENKDHYYRLANGISKFITKLNREKLPILMRTELLDEIFTNFPYEKIPRDFSDFETQTLSFFTKIFPFEYPAFLIPDLVSIPNQIKAHYSNTTKDEVCYLLSKIHSDTDSSSQSVYFTFKYIWNRVEKLKTKANEIEKEYKTIISGEENELEDFFTGFKPIFEHNPKHDKTPYNTKEKWEQTEDKNGFISRLSCYNGRDNIRPQELLDSVYKYGSHYFNYDDEHDVYVVFPKTRGNIYHAYDENDPERIPNEVRRHFNK